MKSNLPLTLTLSPRRGEGTRQAASGQASGSLPMDPLGRASVLDCGDGVFGVAALGRVGSVSGEFWSLGRCQSQSGDFADSVTALQNLADRQRFMRRGAFHCVAAFHLGA